MYIYFNLSYKLFMNNNLIAKIEYPVFPVQTPFVEELLKILC